MADMQDLMQDLSGAEDMLKPKLGIPTLKQLLKDTNDRRAQQQAQAQEQKDLEIMSVEDKDAAMENAAGQLAKKEALEAERQAAKALERPEPPTLEQCLLPWQGTNERGDRGIGYSVLFSDLCANMGANPEMLQTSGPLNGTKPPTGLMMELDRQLLVGGKVLELCRITGSCTEDTAKTLFTLLHSAGPYSSVLAAGEALMSMLGCQPLVSLCGFDLFADGWRGPLDAFPSTEEDLKLGPELDCDAAHELRGAVQMEWLPSDEDLLKALHSSGVAITSDHAAPQRASQEKTSSNPRSCAPGKENEPLNPPSGRKRGPTEGGSTEVSGGQLAMLRPLLRFITALCIHDRRNLSEGVVRRGGLRPHGLQQLVCTLLRLSLDPAAVALSSDLQATVAALISMYTDKDWRCQLPALAAALVKLGPSHRSRLALLRALPGNDARQVQLRAACCALLLQTLVPPSTRSQARPPASKELLDVDGPELVQSLWWTKHQAATRDAARSAAAAGARYDVWELDTAVHLAQLALGPASAALYKRVEAGDKTAHDDPLAKYLHRGGWHSTLKVVNEEMLKVPNKDSVLVAEHAEGFRQLHRLQTDRLLA